MDPFAHIPRHFAARRLVACPLTDPTLAALAARIDRDQANADVEPHVDILLKQLESFGEAYAFQDQPEFDIIGSAELQDNLHASRVQWPPGRMPTELFEEISEYLSRDDIMSMRLVCREFDRHISQVLYKTVVVPFNSHLLDDPCRFEVFGRFGGHIRRFGMSFEVTEDQLLELQRGATEILIEPQGPNFWCDGFDWIPSEYSPFAELAQTEAAAEKYTKLTTAFNELDKVQQLALSIDNGCGWLSGPEKSTMECVLRQPFPVFGSSRSTLSHQQQVKKDLFDDLMDTNGMKLQRSTLYRVDSSLPSWDSDSSVIFPVHRDLSFLFSDDVPAEFRVPYSFAASHTWPLGLPSQSEVDQGRCEKKLLFMSEQLPSSMDAYTKYFVTPAFLTLSQAKYLYEAHHAIIAFLTSYVLAVVDSGPRLDNVSVLRLERMSDVYLEYFDRADFWAALPSLKQVTVLVVSSWRTPTREKRGLVSTKPMPLKKAVRLFYDFLRALKKVDCLRILVAGWATGGEFQGGLLSRNSNLLPAPLLQSDEDFFCPDPSSWSEPLIELPQLEEFKLHNCWVNPLMLCEFVRLHASHTLERLVLNSVSVAPGPVLASPQPKPLPFSGQINSQMELYAQRLEIFSLQESRAEALGASDEVIWKIRSELQSTRHPPLGWDPMHPLEFGLRTRPPVGSWAWIIDRISPGLRLSDFSNITGICESDRTNTTLKDVRFESCGYCAFPAIRFEADLDRVEFMPSLVTDPWFREKRRLLEPLMLTPAGNPLMLTPAGNPLLATITQNMSDDEVLLLMAGWFMGFGWPDDGPDPLSVAMDGHAFGGTGRFSGNVAAKDRVLLAEKGLL